MGAAVKRSAENLHASTVHFCGQENSGKAFAEKMKWEVVAEPNEALGAMKSSDIEQCKAIAQAMAEKIKKS